MYQEREFLNPKETGGGSPLNAVAIRPIVIRAMLVNAFPARFDRKALEQQLV